MISSERWFRLHTAYLQTPEWQARREAVLRRDRDLGCQARLAVCTGDAEQVHHLNYRHWRNEPLFDLVSVCTACHEVITSMDRHNRFVESHGRLGWVEKQPEKIVIE